jgi:S-disulfanyl-L-cysteine oxidoreductase SoxD
MSSYRSFLRSLALCALAFLPMKEALAQPTNSPWKDIGRPATANELKAWDIDVRPDFKGLPVGAGSVAKGEIVWEAQCASCHGTFGESNEVFTPIVGGVSKNDMITGNVANLLRRDFPQRTSLMKLSTVSTLWDYINRAMPWNAPKSLTVEEVYAVTAYILHLGDVLPADYVLSDKNIAQVQAILPNRNGMTRSHGLWQVSAKPDVQGSNCMKDCKPYALSSSLPDYAKDAHGNLSEQSRLIGGLRGSNTAATSKIQKTSSLTSLSASSTAEALAKESNCFACHALENKVLGPSFKQIAVKYKATAGANKVLADRIKNGGQGVWGTIPMPANAGLPDSDLQKLVSWIMGL